MGVRNHTNHVNFNGGVSGFNNPGARVWHVAAQAMLDGETPADTNSGLSPQTAFSTIQKGLDSAVVGRGDVVAVYPGSYTITAALTMTKDDVTLCAAHGSTYGGRSSVTIATTTDSVSMIEIDADNCTVEGIFFDHNTTTAAVPIIDVADTTSCSGLLLRNIVVDMTGSATDTDGIRLGDGTQTVTNSLLEGVVIADYDQQGLIIGDGSDNNTFRDCFNWDDVNVGANGIQTTGDNCFFERVVVKCGGTAGFSFLATSLDNTMNDCRVDATQGAGTIGVLFADGAASQIFNLHVSAQDTGNFVDATADWDANAGVTGFQSDSDGTVCALLNPSVGGTP